MIEVKVAEIAGECTYKKTVNILKYWTPVQVSYKTFKNIVYRVGQAQTEADKEKVEHLENADELSEVKR